MREGGGEGEECFEEGCCGVQLRLELRGCDELLWSCGCGESGKKEKGVRWVVAEF